MGWEYPPNTIVGTIFLVPIEEHLFFILQPILLVLLHCIISHPRLIPFTLSSTHTTSIHAKQDIDVELRKADVRMRIETIRTVQTLPRRPLAAAFWGMLFLVGAVLATEAHTNDSGLVPGLGLGNKAFYLGWILVWITPVIGGLTWLGGSMGRDGGKAWALGSTWLCMVDT